MFNLSYPTNADFLWDASNNHPNLFKTAYVRDRQGINCHLSCWFISDDKDLKSTLLSAVPILGTIRGMARLYSIYAVKDRSNDRIIDIVIHTITGILETLGLGILLLAVKMIILAMTAILCAICVIGTKVGLIKQNP
ncbi:hypothetical protein O1W69_05080 [Chlamydia sp. 12-01]|uniref:hypothetical protein n=1 Tax=Chlamydia sp. 12-01 TaxID=3002742 RepID=UPI0035D423D7